MSVTAQQRQNSPTICGQNGGAAQARPAVSGGRVEYLTVVLRYSRIVVVVNHQGEMGGPGACRCLRLRSRRQHRLDPRSGPTGTRSCRPVVHRDRRGRADQLAFDGPDLVLRPVTRSRRSPSCLRRRKPPSCTSRRPASSLGGPRGRGAGIIVARSRDGARAVF